MRRSQLQRSSEQLARRRLDGEGHRQHAAFAERARCVVDDDRHEPVGDQRLDGHRREVIVRAFLDEQQHIDRLAEQRRIEAEIEARPEPRRGRRRAQPT